MRGVADTSWLEAVPTIGVALLVLFVPGVVAALLLRARPSTALATGPVLTVTAISLGGIAAAQLGVRWGLATLAASVGALWLVTGLAGLVPRVRERHDDGPLWPLAVGAALALAGVAATLVVVSGSADALPQHPDTVFHVSTTRWMAQTGDVSSLHAAGYANGTGSGFYPAAFHAVATTVLQLSGATVVTSISSTVLVTAGVVWPLGVMLLARRVLGATVPVTLAAALASVAFSAFPYWFMGYGVLWPNLFGQALLPAMLAALVAVASGPDRLNASLLLLLGLPGLALAHPNAFIALAIMGAVIVVFALVRQAWVSRSRPVVAVGAVLAAVVVVAAAGGAWAVATAGAGSMRDSNPPGPEMTSNAALFDVLLFGPRDAQLLWVTGALVLAGIVVVLVRHRRQLWLPVAFVVVGGLYFLNAAVDTSTTRFLTWPWYNNTPRLAALLVAPAAVLAAAALAAVVDGVRRLAASRRRPVGVTAATAGVLAAYLLVTLGASTQAHQKLLTPFFNQRASYAWITDGELSALRTLGRKLPADAVVAENPYNGGSYLYLVSGRRVLFTSEKASTTDDLKLLGRSLDEIGRDPQVCAAARRLHVSHVLTGGHPSTFGPSREKRYAGLSAVSLSPTFKYVAGAGPYRLYKVVDCAGS